MTVKNRKEKINHAVKKAKVLKNQGEILKTLRCPKVSIQLLFLRLEELKEYNQQLEKRIKTLETQQVKKNKEKELPMKTFAEEETGNRIARLELD